MSEYRRAEGRPKTGELASGIPCFAYTRVSTAKQRDHGVSLEAQHEAITRYAHENGLQITRWFSESQTAAKCGRTEFAKMLRLLRQGKAKGVIVHKIDRSARNLKDWADFAELTDRGVAVHFAAEALDLASRGGRLSADIQAVVAADYIRNLRQEALKGIQGRYRQGLYPRPAPIGYKDNGGGQVKTPHPIQGRLVREAFERYATGRYGLHSLREVMTRRGLRNTKGRPISINGLNKLLRNPFYTGLIVYRRTGEQFDGKHKPLISRSLFDAVQAVLDGRVPQRRRREYTYRKLLRCALCERTLIAERQKGHVYYRCHTKDCPVKCTREEAVDAAISAELGRVSLNEAGYKVMAEALLHLLTERGIQSEQREKALDLEVGKVVARLDRLTDLVLDGVIGDEEYQKKKRGLLVRRQRLKERRGATGESPERLKDLMHRYLERATRAQLSYERAQGAAKREMAENLTSNRVVSPENVVIELRESFEALAGSPVFPGGEPDRDTPRTACELLQCRKALIAQIITLLQEEDKTP